jgi:hypothetical protein
MQIERNTHNIDAALAYAARRLEDGASASRPA